MGEGDMPMDDKAKRMRDLLSSFYSPDPSVTNTNNPLKYGSLDVINTTSFDADQYMNLLVRKSNLEGLLQKHVEMASEIKNLDTDLQMLVYENYNKFISATDTIKRMKTNIVGMETNMEQLLDKACAKFLIFVLVEIMTVQSKSDGVNTKLFEKREHIEKLHRTRNLLRKVQEVRECSLPNMLNWNPVTSYMIYLLDLGSVLNQRHMLMQSGSTWEQCQFLRPAYGDSSFQDCKRASEEAMAMIIKNLQGKLFSDSESIQARAEAAVLLKQLDFPVDSLKAKLFERLEQSLDGLQLTHEVIAIVSVESSNLSEHGNNTESVPGSAHGALVSEFAEAVRAYQIIFPDSEIQLIKLSQDLITKHFEITSDYIKKWIPIANFLGVLRGFAEPHYVWFSFYFVLLLGFCTTLEPGLRLFEVLCKTIEDGIIWKDVLLIDKVLHEALLPDYSSKASQIAVKQYIKSTFSHLLHDISDALTNVNIKPKEKLEEHPLVVFLEAGKSSVLQGSVNVILDFRQLLEENLGGLQLSDLIVDWVQEGFQDFFRALHDQFLLLSGKNKSTIQDENSTGGMQGEKAVPGLVLVLAQLSVFIEQTAISRITEARSHSTAEIAAYFSGGGGGGGTHENGPAFVPGEICRTFHSAGEMLLQHYINMRTQRISILLRKRFTTPNWFKHKEPREVHMFVDLFLQELEAVELEAKQILPHGVLRKHRRSESNGSSASSLSNSLRDDKMSRLNTHRARSQLLEKHLAKLFKQKVEIFTKTEYTQESVVTTVVKLCLKSLQEFVRLQTFNRSGFQQIQLDVQFLRAALKEIVEDEAAVDFLLDEVIVGASERCLDPIPLEPPILDKLIQVKLAKEKEQAPISH
ncbi:hypothetical protein SADUNF_Sadunf02G0168300 [Salix dunnii]|uniref:Vacuolar protein sorting-associated protein 51 homolog n=1 Tax=Salix dunnii TaxID=1413687 RepID=A0A835N839_9ROSI|nr:hypothetical protein SADUNF_Sadunf02G0168300 [Salix dunnii]